METKLVERLEAAVARLEALAAGGGVSSRELPDFSTDMSIIAFDDLMDQYATKVSDAAEKIGGQVLDVTKLLLEVFCVQLLKEIKQTQKPDMTGFTEFLKPLNQVIMKVTAMAEQRSSEFFNHFKGAGESLSALAWIAYTGKDCGMSMPIAHVEESWQAAEFYTNKVLVEYKIKNPNHVEWARTLKELYLPGLRDYVKSHYPLGPVWNASGKRAFAAPSKAPPPSAPAAPCPPHASLFSSESSKPFSSQPKQGMSAVFQEINSGNATSGLKKVTDDMKSKNRTDRSGVVSTTEKKTRSIPATTAPRVGPPKFELQMGRKWAVENQIGIKNLVIEDCDAKQSVYVFGCKDSVLQIQDVVAAFEIVNCNGVEAQCQGFAPTISVDNTSEAQLYLSKDSLEASITTAKSIDINVLVPGADSNSDWTEHPLPQQYIHVYKNGQFETSPVSHSGA